MTRRENGGDGRRPAPVTQGSTETSVAKFLENLPKPLDFGARSRSPPSLQALARPVGTTIMFHNPTSANDPSRALSRPLCVQSPLGLIPGTPTAIPARTPRVADRRLLALIGEHEVLTSGQLVRLTGMPERTVQHRLGVLYRAGLVDRHRPQAAIGTCPYHVWLTPGRCDRGRPASVLERGSGRAADDGGAVRPVARSPGSRFRRRAGRDRLGPPARRRRVCRPAHRRGAAALGRRRDQGAGRFRRGDRGADRRQSGSHSSTAPGIGGRSLGRLPCCGSGE